MKKLLLILTIFLTLIVSSCDNSNYKQGYEEGYKNGYNKGSAEGYKSGQQEGQKEGYNQGYNDGFEISHKDLTVVESSTKYFYDKSYLVFTYVFFIIFVIIFVAIFFASLFGKTYSGEVIFGKIILFVVALGLAYLSMRLVNLNNIMFFKIQGLWGWLVIISLFPIAIF